LNINGDWDDEGEQFLTNEPVFSGASSTSLANIIVSPSATLGTSFVRIRISTETGLTPRGLAEDGEVEDYQISIRHLHPWQNPIWKLDVTPDDMITPVGDILIGINELNNPTIIDGEGRLPIPPDAPPPFYDVSGDDLLTAVGDLLPIINFLNPGPEGESESGERSSSPLWVDFIDGTPILSRQGSEVFQRSAASIRRSDDYYTIIGQKLLASRPFLFEDQQDATQLDDVLSELVSIAER
jgi:hypothetical protein